MQEQTVQTNGATSNGHIPNAHGAASGAANARVDRASAANLPTVTPAIDVYEGEDGLLVLCDLPGVSSDDLALRLDKDVLTLTAHRKQGLLDTPLNYRRSFSLPREVDYEKIDAKLEEGVLTLRLPRQAAAKPRTIQVKVG